MSRLSIVLSLALLIGTSSMASTRYETIRDLFQGPGSSSVSEANLSGVFAGRCFRKEDPNSSTFSYFKGALSTVKESAGPLFPPVREFHVYLNSYSYNVDAYTPDQADQLVSEPVLAQAAELSVVQNIVEQLVGSRGFSSSSGHYIVDNWGFRRNGAYILAWELQTRGAPNSTPTLNNVDYYCYFFKKISL